MEPMMDGQRKPREAALTALLVSPNRELAQQFSHALSDTKAFHILADLKSYPARNTLDIRLRQLRPDVVLIDVQTDIQTAEDLIRFVHGLRQAAQVVGLHDSNESSVLVRTLRAGACEFLYAPFVPSMQKEAIARLRRLRHPEADTPSEAGKLLVFASAKPGSGSSTIATNLAYAVRKATGKRVLLVDMDLEGGTIAFYLKLQANYSIIDALEQAERLDAGLWSALTVNSSGVDVLPAPELPHNGPIEVARLHDVFEYMRLLYDWVIVDAPTLFHRTSLLTVSESDQAYVVSTSDLTSLHLARKAVNLLLQIGFTRDRYQVIINRLNRNDGIGGSDMGKIFNCQVHANLPNDYFSLHRVISLGQPLAPDCDLGKAISRLAVSVAGGSVQQESRRSDLRAMARPEAGPTRP